MPREIVLMLHVGMGAWLGISPIMELIGGLILIKLPSKYAKKGLRVTRADLEVLPFKKNFFDTILAFDVFEHLLFPAKAMNELNRVCKTGGLILIKTPSAFMPPEEFFVDYTHVRPFTKESLELLLRDHGFEPIYLEYGIRTVSQDNPVAKFIPNLFIPLLSKMIQPVHKFLRDKTKRKGPLLGVGKKVRTG